MRQEVHFVGSDRKVPVGGKPKRVWTLFHEGEQPPELPVVPQHNVNAFLEDHIHDWDWRGGTLRYYSRVAKDSVWILCEFTE